MDWNADSITKMVNEKKGFTFKRVTKRGKWVSSLAREAKKWGTVPGGSYHFPKWITAPTGSGKSTFVLNDLAKIAKERQKSILFLSSRSAQIIQQKRDKADVSNVSLPSMDQLSNTDIIDNIFISTYNGWFSFKKDHCTELSNVEFVIFDEAHYFLNDSSFNPFTFYILSNIIESFLSSVRIYLRPCPYNGVN